MLYIIRHGKTEWNVKHKLQGRTDIPLSDEGIKMAQAAAREYSNVHFDVCYCSPLIRARKTAEILLEGRAVPIIPDKRLVEMCFGVYEGTENSFQQPCCPIYNLFFHPEKYTVPVEGGESFDELFARTGEFLRQTVMPQVKQGKDILIVGHGAMNLSIVCQVKKLPIEKFWDTPIENCKLIRLL